MRWFALLVLALALVAAGCGGGDDESSASDDTTIEETTTLEETTDDTTTDDATTDDDVDLSGVLADEDCRELANIGVTFGQAIAGATDAEAAEAFQDLVDDVPDEIEADVQVLADWFAEYAATLQDIGIEAGQTPSAQQLAELQAAFASLDQENVSAASERLGAWAEANCSAAGG
jgi:hypothetical protein